MMNSRFGGSPLGGRRREVTVADSGTSRPEIQQKTMCGQVRKLLDFIRRDCSSDARMDETPPLNQIIHSQPRTNPACPRTDTERRQESPKKQSRGCTMDTAEFRKRGREMVDYIADYLESISQRRVTPNVEPGYLRNLIPNAAPKRGEDWDDIMKDVERYIMPGVTHWQHPRFHAYFPAGNAYPSILADMLSDAIGCVGFSWAASPACTELETIMLDWLGKMIGLPEDFLCLSDKSKGGGVIQGSASDCILVNLLAARHSAIKALKQEKPFVEEGTLLSSLMAYCSKEAHSSVEKAAMIGFVKLRILDTDEKFQLRGETLAKAMEEDRNMGLKPFFVAATLGTTSCCSFDPISEIGPVCEKFGVWLHVDAAYAGSALICPEFQHLLRGIEYAMSFNMNPNKWMLVNFDCSTMWVKDRFKLTQALVVDPLYLQHSFSDKSIDYRHWGIPLSRRFRSLKLWFVIRKYGVEGLQKYIREHVRLAKKFESLVRKDDRFIVANQVHFGLVCFRLKGTNSLNQKLLSSINASGKLHMVPASLSGNYVIRFCVCAQHATDADIIHAWDVITMFTEEILELMKVDMTKEEIVEEEEEEEEEEEAEEEEEEKEIKEHVEESVDEVFLLERKRKHSLKYKRSFFVRMVSDPKLYNPKIVRALSSTDSRRHTSDPVDSETGVITPV